VIFGPFKLILRIIAGIVGVIVLYFAVTFVQIWLTSHEHSSANADAILVFGTTEDDGVASPELQARLDQALLLYREGRAPWVVVTGGNRPGDNFTESQVSKTYLERHGVPPARIVQGFGNDTWQNVATALSAMKEHDIVTVITVTDPFHEYRAMAISSAQGLHPVPSPVPDSPTIKHSLWRYYLKETFDVGVGRIVGYGRLSSWTSAPAKIYHSSGA
jgi:uncharacterized SAM-binding protein YcdF (DUF218 family)